MITDQKNFLAAKHGTDKVVPSCPFAAQLRRRIEGWIHIPTQAQLCWRQRLGQLAEAYLARVSDDKKIDITSSMVSASGK